MADTKGYKDLVLRRLENLQFLDSKPVTIKEREIAKDGSSLLTMKMILEHSYVKRRDQLDDEVPVRLGIYLRLVNTMSSLKLNRNCGKTEPTEEIWKKIYELDLSHQGIRKVQNLDR